MSGQEAKGRISDETFDEFLASQGMLEDCEEVAIKRVLAYQIREAMAAHTDENSDGGQNENRPPPVGSAA